MTRRAGCSTTASALPLPPTVSSPSKAVSKKAVRSRVAATRASSPSNTLCAEGRGGHLTHNSGCRKAHNAAHRGMVTSSLITSSPAALVGICCSSETTCKNLVRERQAVREAEKSWGTCQLSLAGFSVA